MAGRIRTFKPEMIEDEVIAALDDTAYRLFTSMVLLADDHGNLRASADWLKGQVFFRRHDVSTERVAKALADVARPKPGGRPGLIQLYEINGQQYATITKWTSHQRVNHPGKPRVPLMSEVTLQRVSENLGESQESLLPHTSDLRPPTNDQRPPTSDLRPTTNARAAAAPHAPPPAAPVAEVERVVDHYREIHEQARPGEKERKLIRARLKEGYSAEQICSAIDGCHVSPHHCGANDTGTKYQTLELIVRDSKHVAQFIEQWNARDEARDAERRRPPKNPTAAERSMDAARRIVEEAEAEERTRLRTIEGGRT